MAEPSGTTVTPETSGLDIVKHSLRSVSYFFGLINKQVEYYASAFDWMFSSATKEEPTIEQPLEQPLQQPPQLPLEVSPEVLDSELTVLGGHHGIAVILISSLVTFVVFTVATFIVFKRRKWKERASSVRSGMLHSNQIHCVPASIACQITTADDREESPTDSTEVPSESEHSDDPIAPATSPDITDINPKAAHPQHANTTPSAKAVTETGSIDPSSDNLDSNATEVISENSLGKQNNCNIQDASHSTDVPITQAKENKFFVSASQKKSPKKLRNQGCTHKRSAKRARPINNSSTEHSAGLISKNFHLKKTDTPVLSSLKGEGAFQCYSKTTWASAIEATDTQSHYYKNNGASRQPEDNECVDTDETDMMEEFKPKRFKREGFKNFQEPVCLQYSQKRAYDLGNIGRHNTKYLAEGGQTSSNELSSCSKEVVDTHAPNIFVENSLMNPNNSTWKGNATRLDNNGTLNCNYFPLDHADKNRTVNNYFSPQLASSNQPAYKPYQPPETEKQALSIQNVDRATTSFKNCTHGINNEGVMLSENLLQKRSEKKKRKQCKANVESLLSFPPSNEFHQEFSDQGQYPLSNPTTANEANYFRHIENDGDLNNKPSQFDQVRFMEQFKCAKTDMESGKHLLRKRGHVDEPFDERQCFQSKDNYPALSYNNVRSLERQYDQVRLDRKDDNKFSANRQAQGSMQRTNLIKNVVEKMSKVQLTKRMYQQPCPGSIRDRKHSHVNHDVKRYNEDSNESTKDMLESELAAWKYANNHGFTHVGNGDGSFNSYDNVGEKEHTYCNFNGHYNPISGFHVTGDDRPIKTTSGWPDGAQYRFRDDYSTQTFPNHLKHSDNAQDQPTFRAPVSKNLTSSNEKAVFGHKYRLLPGRMNQYESQAPESQAGRFEPTHKSNGNTPAHENGYPEESPENNRTTLTAGRRVRCLDVDKKYFEIKSIHKDKKGVKRLESYKEVTKKSKSLISVSNIMSHLAANPAVKFLRRRDDPSKSLKPNQWIYQYHQQHQCSQQHQCPQEHQCSQQYPNPQQHQCSQQHQCPQQYQDPQQPQFDSSSFEFSVKAYMEVAQSERMSDKEADKLVKCKKSKKAKIHRHAPYRKHPLISSDGATFIRHDGAFIRNKNNCSPSRRGRFVTAPKVDLQYFNQDDFPKVCRTHNRSRTTESMEAMFVKPAMYDRATQRSRSFSENDQCTQFTQSGSEDGRNAAFDPPRGTQGKGQPFKNDFFSLDRQMLGDSAKETQLLKNTETSDTLTRSDAQDSLSAMENLMYPINPPAVSNNLASPPGSIAQESGFSQTEECSFGLEQRCVANQTARSMTQSQITQTDGTLQMSTVDVQTSPHLGKRFTETTHSTTMTQNHTTQTDASVLTTNVDVQTSPILDEQSTKVHYLLTDACVQTSPQQESLDNRETSHQNSLPRNVEKTSKNHGENPKFVRDCFSKGFQNTFDYKRNSSTDGAAKPKSFSALGTADTTRDTVLHWNLPEIKDFRDGDGERASWLFETAQTSEEEDSCDSVGAENVLFKNNSTRKCGAGDKTKETKEVFHFGSRNSENYLQTNLKKADRTAELLKPPTEAFVAPVLKMEMTQARRFLPTSASHLQSQAEEVSEKSFASSKISELKSLYVARPAWKNANVDEIDRRVKRSLQLREELLKQKSSTVQVKLKLPISDKGPETERLVKTDEHPKEIKNASAVCPKERTAQTNLAEPFPRSETNHSESGSRDKQDCSPIEQRPKVTMVVASPDPSSGQSSDDENDSNESDIGTEQTKSYQDSLVTSSQTNNGEQKTLKRARAKDYNSPPTKISKVENAQAKQVKLVGETVNCLPQVPLASLIEWFIETSLPNTYVSSDHSTQSPVNTREEKATCEAHRSVSEEQSCYVRYMGKTTKLQPALRHAHDTKAPSPGKFPIPEDKSSNFKAKVTMESGLVSSDEIQRISRESKQWEAKMISGIYTTPNTRSLITRNTSDSMRHVCECPKTENRYTCYPRNRVTEGPPTPGWCSQDDGDSVVISEFSASGSGTTGTQIEISSSLIQTPTAQLAYEDYSDGESALSTAGDDTVSSVETCTADLSVFMDGYGDSDAKKGAMSLASPMAKAAACIKVKSNDYKSGAASHNDTGDKRSEDDDRCASGRGHVFMNFRKTTDSHEVARFDRTRIRLMKSSDLTGIITKVQKDDS